MNKYSTFGRRFTASIIDSIVLWPLNLINGYTIETANRLTFIIGSLIFSVTYLAYFIFLHGKYGQTFGKKIVGIKVVDVDETTLIGTKRAIIRELPWIIADMGIFIYLCIILFDTHSNLENAKDSYSSFTFIISITWLLVELLTMFTNYKRRAVHDYLAKSVVIKTDR